jgi:HD superfamily phosphodiesterase
LAEALPRRWAHVQGVARQAERVAAGLGAPSTLAAAARLHDVGSAAGVKDTGFHPPDALTPALVREW